MNGNLECAKCGQDTARLTYEQDKTYKIFCECGYRFIFQEYRVNSIENAEDFYKKILVNSKPIENMVLRTYQNTKVGYLYYDADADRIDMRVTGGESSIGGFHCGDTLQVKLGTEWVDTRVEYSDDKGWYLVGVDLNPAIMIARI